MRHFRIFFCLFVVTVCSISAVRADSLDQFVKETMINRKIPGLSIAVIRGGKVLRETGYGYANLELQVPASENTVYEIGSISKQFAAEAVMLLVQDGMLNVDEPITNSITPTSSAMFGLVV